MTKVTVDGATIRVEGLELTEHSLAAFVADREACDRPELAERALRIGLLATRDAGITVNVDFVQREFQQIAQQLANQNDVAARALESVLRENFADGDGRLPRTLERFLGDGGKLRLLVDQLFDEKSRDSAIGRIKAMLGEYLDGDDGRLAKLLDPTRQGSPLHQFRNELDQRFREIGERLAAMEVARVTRESERARGTAKGGDFEDQLEARLAELAASVGDHVERTAHLAGDSPRAKQGDLVITLNPAWTNGLEVRIAVEAKDSPVSLAAMRRNLEAARRNRGADVAMAVYSAGAVPATCDPLNLHGSDVYCAFDPDDWDGLPLVAAFRLARALALAAARRQEIRLDAGRVAEALGRIQNAIEMVRRMKTRLTGIRSGAQEVADMLDEMRGGISDAVADIEAELQAVEPAGEVA